MTDRTPEEREAARLERMRRRGTAPPDATPPAVPPAPEPQGDSRPAPSQPPPVPPPPRTPPSQERPIGTVPLGSPRSARRAAPNEPEAPHRSSGRHALFFGGAALAVAALLFVIVGTFQPFKGDGGEPVRVRIPAGLGVGGVGSFLANQGVVSSGPFFAIRATLAGKRSDLRSGTYTLRKGMSNGAALDALTATNAAAPVINVSIPEGPSRREVAPIVARQGVSGDYLKASVSSALLNPRRYGAPSSARTLEGFLFPATYELLRAKPDARSLVDDQVKAFRSNFSDVNMAYARSKNLTGYDVVTIASMIERETSVASERPLVAAVIYNRLRKGIPLGIDASTRFAVGNWTAPLTSTQLRSNSPYNTRNRQGLPPGPIGNPGLASLKAAARPARVNYLYYVVAPCKGGAHAFSSTDAEFQQDVAAYNAKRTQLGGRDPKVCK